MNSKATTSEERLIQVTKIKNVLESASMGVWCITITKDGQKSMNATKIMLRLLGIDPDKSISDSEVYERWYAGIFPEALQSVKDSMAAMLRNERSENTYKWMHPTLGRRYVRCGGVGRVEKDGTTVFEGYHYDVTDAVLQAKQNRLVVDAFAKTYTCLFYIYLLKDEYIAYSDDLPLVSKYMPRRGHCSEAVTTFIKHLCAPCHRAIASEFLDISTLNERLKYRNSISMQFLSVANNWNRMSIIVSDRNADNTLKHLVVTVKDITKQKEKEDERNHELKVSINANHSKTLMIQNMTHEIRTPLNAMFGFSQLLCMPDTTISEEQKAEYYNHIYNSFNMLSMLIDDVLDITDAEHGNYHIEKTNFAVNAICRSALQMTEIRKAASVNLYFTSEVDDDFTIESDSRRIQQVLVNFLTNACKHTTHGEIHLHLSVTETPGRLTFSVTDTGEGVPPEMAKNIFKRYKKANSSVQGSGLGLHICSIIAEKLGADIKLDEKYKNGARFLFIL